MISPKDKATIVELAQQFQAKRVILFGSSASATGEGRDIDLAVSGVAPSAFYRLYGSLIFALSKPLDLVDLDKESSFTRMICDKGIPIYVGSVHTN